MKKIFLFLFLAIIISCASFFVYQSGQNKESASDQRGLVDNKPIAKPETEIKTVKLATIADDDYNAIKVSDKEIESAFSPDGKRVAYLIKRGLKSSVFINNAEGQWYDDINWNYGTAIQFSADGNHYAYTAKQGGKQYIIADGSEQQVEGKVQNISLGNDGKIILYTLEETREGKNFGRIKVVFRDNPGDYFDNVMNVALSPDNSYVVYYGCTYNYPDSACDLVSQDASGQKVVDYAGTSSDLITNGDIGFNPKGNIYAFISKNGDSAQLNVNGNSIWPPVPGSFGKNNIHQFIFSPDGAHLSYIVEACNKNVECGKYKGQGKFFVITDNNLVNKEGYDYAEMLMYSDDSNSLAYFARKGENWFLIKNNVEIPIIADNGKVKDGGMIIFNPNGELLYTYIDENEQDHLIFNEKEVAVYEEILVPNFTPKNQILFTTIKDKKMLLVIDGKEKEAYDLVWPFFSVNKGLYDSFYKYTPDGGNVIYGAIKGKELWLIAEPL